MVVLPVPVALARLTDTFTPVGVKSPVWEPKWDGYRALAGGGRLFSRRGTNLTRYFPDLTPVLAARLPADLVLDGELVAWDVKAGRLDFHGLQARMTAGRRLSAVATRRPAQFVAFDVLQADGDDLRQLPLRERRRVLEGALSGLASPIVLGQQTDDLAAAQEWFATLSAGGIEGVIVKDADGRYPTSGGQRIWWKYKARSTVDLLAVGFTGAAAAPQALVLAFPGQTNEDGSPVTAGSTSVLTRAAARTAAPLLRATGATFDRAFAWGQSEPSVVSVIEPVVVEVEADASVEYGTLRHAARLIRVRADLDPDQIEHVAY